MLATYDQSIEEISQSIFSTMLGIDLLRTDAQENDLPQSLQAAIHIAGAWTGCVVISLSDGVSHYAAANLLGVEQTDISEEDVKDTVTELANMVGGNLKSLLPGPSYLSLPSLIQGHELGLRQKEASLIDDVWFDSERGTFRVRVLHKV